MDGFLRVLGFQVHEWKQLIEVSVYHYLPTSYFATVAESSAVNISILSTKELFHSGCRNRILVYGFILEQDYVPDLREIALVLPGDSESAPSIFLLPQHMEHVESDVPSGDLLVDGSCRVDLVSETLSKPLENMVGSKGEPQQSTEDQRSVVEFFNNSMCPCEQFLVVHDQLVRADE